MALTLRHDGRGRALVEALHLALKVDAVVLGLRIILLLSLLARVWLVPVLGSVLGNLEGIPLLSVPIPLLLLLMQTLEV